MKPRPLGKLRSKTPWLVLLGVLAFGCSRLPTAPVLTNQDLNPAPVSSAGIRIIPVDPPDGGGITLPPVLEPDSLVRAEDIDGDEGGAVSIGNVGVEVPQGAYVGGAQIRITIPDEDSLMCHLEIFPASKNQFAEPVTVTFDVHGVEDTHNLGVFWFNEERGRWVQIPADLNAERKTISAELSHFSVYKVAKASWNLVGQ